MTDRKCSKRRKFAHEILGLIGVSALFALILYLLLTGLATAVVEDFCFQNDIVMTEFDWIDMERWILSLGTLLSVCVFCILFLSLLSDRMAYIRTITRGIDAMGQGTVHPPLPLEGSNELTELASAINDMSAAQQRIRQAEQALAQEKEQLIRSLSHDIRTPLTSILAYSEYLAEEDSLTARERRAHLLLIRRKAQQIRELTDILLDGTKRNVEHFSDARLLMEQLAAELEEELEDSFPVRAELSGCRPFSGSFDVQELRRIFDNLSSNVRKYADPAQPVCLAIRVEGNGLVIRQSNAVLVTPRQEDSYGLGLPGIRRIAQHYGGSVSVEQDGANFAITILLSDF